MTQYEREYAANVARALFWLAEAKKLEAEVLEQERQSGLLRPGEVLTEVRKAARHRVYLRAALGELS